MSDKAVVLVDVENLCYRHYHAFKYTNYDNPVVFGLLQSLGLLSQQLGSDNFAFCFDSGDHSPRRAILPSYKLSREDSEGRATVKRGAWELKKSVLPDLGYERLLEVSGWEADDVMAEAAARCYESDVGVLLVTTDTDAYQLLREYKVSCWNPAFKTTLTAEDVFLKYGVRPTDWVRYKAMIGCDTDNVPGVPGVGPVTARKVLRGEITAEHPRGRKVLVDGAEIVARNEKLIRLPFGGRRELPNWSLTQEPVTRNMWDCVMRKYELDPLVGKCPS